jgi:hypothetical protein
MSITTLTLLVFLNQLIFIGLRTYNVRTIADNKITASMITGFFIHLAWLLGISIGANAGIKILDGQWEYLPVVLASSIGGLLGTFLAMKQNIGTWIGLLVTGISRTKT